MSAIRVTPLPGQALLQRYVAAGAYTDCYSAVLSGEVRFADYVEAFYTSPLFKLERAVLRWFVARPSTDEEARALGRGDAQGFAAWSVEDRTADQLLLCDFQQRTRSWLMRSAEGGTGTRLYFGSAVVPVVDGRTGTPRMGAAFRALLGFHKLYSRLLLGAACRRLRASGKDGM